MEDIITIWIFMGTSDLFSLLEIEVGFDNN